MQKTIDETIRRRSVQLKYNEEHGITPQQIEKSIKGTLTASETGKEGKAGSAKAKQYNIQPYLEADTGAFAADPVIAKMSDAELKRSIDNTKSLMKEAAAKLDFMQAAQYRDEMLRLQDILDGRGKNE